MEGSEVSFPSNFFSCGRVDHYVAKCSHKDNHDKGKDSVKINRRHLIVEKIIILMKIVMACQIVKKVNLIKILNYSWILSLMIKLWMH